jgi:hypothetical protein
MIASLIWSVRMSHRVTGLLLLVAALTCGFAAAHAEMTRIEVSARSDVLDGKPFGDAGPYEKIVGKAFFAVDPGSTGNARIVDIDKAPSDAAGRVAFTADFYALIPKDAARRNGAALVDVVNRGRKNMLATFNQAPPRPDPTAEADFGDGFLMRHGFTLIWIGWQFDIPSRNGLMGLQGPTVSENGRPITGQVATSFVPNTSDPTYRLDDLGRYGDTSHYPPTNPASPGNALSVRDGFLATPHPIGSDRWQFGRMVDGGIVPDPTAMVLKGGFEPGHVYELSFDAGGATVPGLGLAALRDLASALKHGKPDVLPQVSHVYAFGPSQDGRLLRQFLYDGFNADERGERAFDGIIAHIAGASRGDFNARFARPNGAGNYSATLFPYLDDEQTDPVTGKRDGLLSKLGPAQRPKIFYTNTSTEYWGLGRAAALTHTAIDGQEDAQVPDNVRIYLFAGTQHVPGGFLPSQGPGQQQPNPNQYAWGLRALLIGLDRWVKDGAAPPASRHPRIADETLVPQPRLEFPALPGVRSPATIPGPYRADLVGLPAEHPLPFLVPNVDRDGNETAGIRLPDQAVPLATYTGWNFRNPSIGQPGEMLPLTGSYIPFPVTRAAREQSGDPRASLEERYQNRAAYQALVEEAAGKLVASGYLLAEDRPGTVTRAMARWDVVTVGTPLAGK